MKRTILLVVILLAVNILIEGFAAIAFISICFRSDMVAAGIFGAVAMLGMLPQPWYLALLLLPYGVLYAPVAATLITFLVYRWLDRQGKIPVQITRLRMARWTRIVAGVVLVLTLLAGIGYARLIDFPALNHHAPRIIEHDNAIRGIRNNRSYCVSDFINSEWLWHARVTAPQMAALRAQYHLYPVETSKVPKEFFDMSPYWWRPKVTPTVHAYSTAVSPVNARGDDGMYMLSLWDQQGQGLYMWIKFNF